MTEVVETTQNPQNSNSSLNNGKFDISDTWQYPTKLIKDTFEATKAIIKGEGAVEANNARNVALVTLVVGAVGGIAGGVALTKRAHKKGRHINAIGYSSAGEGYFDGKGYVTKKLPKVQKVEGLDPVDGIIRPNDPVRFK